MERKFAVYTQSTQCQDCYKCLRVCPAKAISVKEGHASVDPGLCLACGKCVAVCPAKAKKIRNDLARARFYMESGREVYACLAPSWMAEFPDLSARELLEKLGRLGFSGAIEAALGAEAVSRWTADYLKLAKSGVYFSSACPVCNEYILNFYPELSGNITPVVSPAVAAGRLLRQTSKTDIRIVFIGPCIAKKNESAASDGVIDLAITFSELREWLDDGPIEKPKTIENYSVANAIGGRLYPIEGGMLRTIREGLGEVEAQLVSICGLGRLEEILRNLHKGNFSKPVLVECLACEGGCLGGPGMACGRAGLTQTLTVTSQDTQMASVKEIINLSQKYKPEKVNPTRAFNEEMIRSAMLRVGKDSPEDELNCSGCGYDTCRDFAHALLEGRAEEDMCVSHMRRQAQKKANALLRCMPSGVVIVNNDLELIECNESFARLFGEDTVNAFKTYPGLPGAELERIVPLGGLFKAALRSGTEIFREHYPVGERLFNVNVFVIEPGRTAGAVIQDVTRQEIKREQIARQAKEVIRKNIATVQEIACLLGEHVTDTEILLSNIAEGYAPDNPEQDNDLG